MLFDLVLYCLGAMIICVMYYQISMYVVETAIGNAAVAGILSTVLTIGTFVACVTGPLYGKCKQYLPIIIFACIAITYALFAFVPNLVGAGIAMALDGIANGLIMSLLSNSSGCDCAGKASSVCVESFVCLFRVGNVSYDISYNVFTKHRQRNNDTSQFDSCNWFFGSF